MGLHLSIVKEKVEIFSVFLYFNRIFFKLSYGCRVCGFIYDTEKRCNWFAEYQLVVEDVGYQISPSCNMVALDKREIACFGIGRQDNLIATYSN